MSVVAYNKRGQKQVFSDMAWKLLGKDKGGWVEKPSQIIENKSKIEPPYMGPAIKKEDQVIENKTGKTEEEIHDQAIQEKHVSISETEKSDFLDAVKGLNKTIIKDYFDQQTPPVKYKNKISDADLQKQFAEHLNYDIIKLQKVLG